MEAALWTLGILLGASNLTWAIVAAVLKDRLNTARYAACEAKNKVEFYERVNTARAAAEARKGLSGNALIADLHRPDSNAL